MIYIRIVDTAHREFCDKHESPLTLKLNCRSAVKWSSLYNEQFNRHNLETFALNWPGVSAHTVLERVTAYFISIQISLRQKILLYKYFGKIVLRNMIVLWRTWRICMKLRTRNLRLHKDYQNILLFFYTTEFKGGPPDCTRNLEKCLSRREKDTARYTLLYCRNLQGKGIWNLPLLHTAINREVFFRLCQRHYFSYFLQSFSIIFIRTFILPCWLLLKWLF